MKFEDLMLDRAETVAEQAALLNNRLIALRRTNRQEIINTFDREEHRLEHVTWVGGVKFINDSKSCTPNATYYSFEKVKNELVWIAGGNNSKIDYSDLIGQISRRVNTLVCIGKDNRKLFETFSGIITDIVEEQDMEEAVMRAYYAAKNNDAGTVLLSTACEPDELYPNYQARGNEFKKAIAQL